MIIDAKDEATTLRKTNAFVMMVLLIIIVGTFLWIQIDATVKFIIIGVSIAATLIYYWFQYKMEYTYFYFSNNRKDLIFRFYSLRIFSGKPKTIEIPKINFVKYDISTCFFDKKDSLVLFQRTPKGVVKYPPIPLTLLNKKQKTELKRALFAEIAKV